MARSIVTALVEHDPGVDPHAVLNRAAVGRRLFGDRGSVIVREVLTAQTGTETPAPAPAAAPQPTTTNEFLAALLEQQRQTFALLSERLPG